MKFVAALLALCAVAFAQDEDSLCRSVPAVAGFKVSQFEGTWYEVGQMRSTGAAIFDDGCMCSRSNMTVDAQPGAEGDATYSYGCNLDSEDGDKSYFDTELREMNPPGQWQMTVVAFFDPHNFTVVDMGDNFALTYRCGDYVLADSYTIQFLSRKPTLDDATVGKMKAKVVELGINTDNVEYSAVTHNDQCQYA